MSQIEHNLISAEEIELFKQYYNKFSTEKYVNATTDDHLMVDQGPIIDHRLLIEPSKSQQCWDIVQRVTHHFLPGCENIWANYQRQSLPHSTHVDDYCKHFDVPTYTVIIALDTHPEFNVILCKEEANSNDHLSQMLYDWATPAPDPATKICNISDTEDLEHSIDPVHQQYFLDWLTPDGVFRYTAGSGVFFLASQIHCSGNWHKYNKFINKDLVQIHAHYNKGTGNVSI
jgi:hypothetical protein